MALPDGTLPSSVTIDVLGRQNPPGWAVKQRHLIELMDRAARFFVERYTRPDGTLIWRDRWPGMDGSDDGYESFVSFPLLYIVGGGEHVHELARKEWNAVTWQFTEYGQVYREFDAYYDWMHHGESYTYTYYLALANPDHHTDRSRALRFASMYCGHDAEAPNWDSEFRLIRSPINGSRGPRLRMSAEDWVTHRPVLAGYLAPYEDIPGYEILDPLAAVDWNDDRAFEQILKQMNERMVPGDVPLNLNATSLMTHAFMYTGENRYREWVLDYLQAWAERTARNGGIMPDNVGPAGQIGERMGGKWWGGYYGWRWPHGAWIILESTLIAGCNATLLTGDPGWLDLHRSQGDLLWALRKEEGGKPVVPARHGDRGWFDYRPLNPVHYIHAGFLSQCGQDRRRILERFPDGVSWRGGARYGKAGSFSPLPWYAYMEGQNPGFPDQVLEDTYTGISQRIERIEQDSSDPETWDVHHWQDLNPVIPEGLVQMTMGTPAAVYHGGLLHASVRYFDPKRRRPGLPEHVAALVQRISADSIELTIVNTDPLECHEVIVQGGTFGEHRFTVAQYETMPGMEQRLDVEAKHLRVRLGPSAQAHLCLGMRRFAEQPSYAFPSFC
jgi:hypothetical protein